MVICVFGGQLKAEGLVDDADEFLLGVEADDALGVAIERTDEQEGDAAYLEDVGDVAVLIDIDTVEVHLTVVMLGNLPQHGFQAPARHTPVGVEIHDDRARAEHLPIGGAIVSDEFHELVLSDGVDRINGILLGTIALGAGTKGQ